MPKMIFVNLPVTNLAASLKFYKALGFTVNPQFSDETAACLIWSDTIHVMLLTHAKWRTFTDRPIPPANSSEVMLALSCDDRAAVDVMTAAAAANGGQATSVRSKTTVLCTLAISSTPMVMLGGRSGLTRPRCSKRQKLGDRRD